MFKQCCFSHSRFWAVCFMPIMYLCGCVFLSSTISACSSLTWGSWCCVSSILYCQVHYYTVPHFILAHPRVLFFKKTCSKPATWIFCDICAGVLVLLLAFFAFLHCWLNAFAEMLRFGDRMFYKVWHDTFTWLDLLQNPKLSFHYAIVLSKMSFSLRTGGTPLRLLTITVPGMLWFTIGCITTFTGTSCW